MSDYLRDSSAFNRSEIVQRPFNYCVIDEIDSILIDEARTPLILSAETGDNNINKLYLTEIVDKTKDKKKLDSKVYFPEINIDDYHLLSERKIITKK